MTFKHHVFLLSVVMTAIAGCRPPAPADTKAPEPEPVIKSFAGLYKWAGDTSKFTACDNGRKYTMIDGTHSLDTLYAKSLGYGAYPGDQVFVALQGFVKSTGTAADVPDVLVITRVDSVETKNMENCCIPYEFWCSGTEPFWSLQISQAEDGLFLSDPNAEHGTRFPWSAPKVKKNTWIYESAGTGPDSLIRVVVRKQACSDGMSDTKYRYSAEVQIGQEKLRGCAVRGGEPLPKRE